MSTRSCRSRPVALALLACAALGCRSRPPPSAPAAAQARFCPQDLSGVWLNASDTGYAYRLRDRGDEVDGVFFRRAPDGGAIAPEPTEEPMTIDLHRTATALAGAMRSFDRTTDGRRCPVEFGLSVTSCAPGSLQVVSETAAPIEQDCKRRREADGGDAPAQLSEFVWERPDGGR